AGGCALAEEALAAMRSDRGNDVAGRLGIARFFAEHMAIASGGLEREVIGGADAILAAPAALAG
ncbi:MAG TPA: acyl-CoA dehydrogenase, partial [Xanthobacteraceae bacterium]